jgi:hypothetical protein
MGCAPFHVPPQPGYVCCCRISAHSVSNGIMAGPAHLWPARDRLCDSITFLDLRYLLCAPGVLHSCPLSVCTRGLGSSVMKIHMHAAGIPKNLRGGIASVLFALPVIKHNYAWAGCMAAGKPQSLPCWGCTSASAPVQANPVQLFRRCRHAEHLSTETLNLVTWCDVLDAICSSQLT